MVEEVQGDLDESFAFNLKSKSKFQAQMNYWFQVFNYLRPFAIKNIKSKNSTLTIMFSHYFKISWRNLLKNKGYSAINIGGLAIGIAVALMIGFWVQDELSYDKYNKNYDKIARVMRHQSFHNNVFTFGSIELPVAQVLKEEYGDRFDHVVLSTWNGGHILSNDNTKIKQTGNFMQKEITSMISLDIVSGVLNGLKDPYSIMISKATATALFGDEDPLGKEIRFDNTDNLVVTSVYENIPANSHFRDLQFIVPWSFYKIKNEWVTERETNWWSDSHQLFVQLADNVDLDETTERIRNIKIEKVPESAPGNPQMTLHPMKDWRLRGNFENGIKIGGAIEYVRLFETIGVFVLILACINFMNLSTARSEKRSKEIGIRKSIGSIRQQLIGQFLNESFMVVVLSFILALIIIQLTLPNYNLITNKQITIPWDNVGFWGIAVLFIAATSLLAGSYPALYLSSFNPIKALKGTFKAGKYAAVPRKILVVTQFSVSVSLIIGTLIIFNQIAYTKNRPIGYKHNGLIQIPVNFEDYKGKYDVIRNELTRSGAVNEVSASQSPLTAIWNNQSGTNWEGKPDDFQDSFAMLNISVDYGNSINWKVLSGRDFSRDHSTDSIKVIVNESAARYMGFKDPVGKYLWGDDTVVRYEIIGMVQDIITQSPYEPVKQAIYFLGNPDAYSYYNLRLNSEKSVHENIATIEKHFIELFPDVPFTYQFIDEQYGKKFRTEERIGKLTGIFTFLAILISCLGLFGLASFIAEQRTKEIGIRKILGASVIGLWRMLSKDFVILVVVSCIIATPIAYLFMKDWLEGFDYRINISWWVFVLASIGAILLTLVTVSFQAIKAALINPVKSLKSE